MMRRAGWRASRHHQDEEVGEHRGVTQSGPRGRGAVLEPAERGSGSHTTGAPHPLLQGPDPMPRGPYPTGLAPRPSKSFGPPPGSAEDLSAARYQGFPGDSG